MPGETSGPNPINTETLHSVVETSGDAPSTTEVIDSFSDKMDTLRQKVADLESQPGFNLDATEMMQKRRDIAATKADLSRVEGLWDQLGGKDIEAATELKQGLDFKADADDHVVADANVREAQDAFYTNFLNEYSKDSTADTSKTTEAETVVVNDTTNNEPASQTSAFNLEAEMAASEARTQEKVDNFVPKVERYLEENYPKAALSETEVVAPPASVAETRFPTHEEVITRLKESDRWKNASEDERKVFEDMATNEWSAQNAARNNIAKVPDKPIEEESGAESEYNDHFPTLDEVLARLRETDRWKNASEEDRQIYEAETANQWVAANAEHEKTDRTDDVEEVSDEESVDEQGETSDDHFPTLDEVLARLRETDRWKNASEEDRQIYEAEATNQWVAANADREKSNGENNTGTGEESAEAQLSPEEKAVQERLATARNEYARLTAHDRRSFLGRFLQGDGWLSNRLRRVPAIASFMNSINDRFGGAEMKQAIAAFESATKDAMKAAEARLVEEGISPESQEFKEKKIALQIDADRDLEDKIIEERHAQSKKAGRFTNWWVRQNVVVKGLTVLGAGAAVGAGAGLVAAVAGVAGVTVGIFGLTFGTGASVAGGLAGGATGFGIAKGVSSRRANAIVGDGETVAQQQSRIDRTQKANSISQADGDTDTALTRLIRVTEQSTSNEMLRNRKRVRTMAGLGASAGALAGGFTGGKLHDYLSSRSTADATDANNGGSGGEGSGGDGSEGAGHPGEGDGLDGAGGDGTGTEGAVTGDTPEVRLDNTFNVEQGSGLIREWDQWASANGHPIDRETASQLHQAVLKQFGPEGIIDLKGIGKAAETYIQNGDVRLGAPAGANWRSGVAEFAQRWLETQGKW